MRVSVVAGNWKMHGSVSFLEEFASDLAGALAQAGPESGSAAPELLIFPAAPHLALARSMLPPEVAIGAQNIHAETQGAFTGELSAEMLDDMGIGWVLVGHSERRALFGETNTDTAAKVQAAQRTSVAAVLCVGETIDERRAGRAAEVVLAQLNAVLDVAGLGWLERGMVAYEPVWAIGTGETATPAQAQEMHGVIRQALAGRDADLASKVRLLYGGSVNPENAAELFGQADIDGGLVGGASLAVEKFVAIARAVG